MRRGHLPALLAAVAALACAVLLAACGDDDNKLQRHREHERQGRSSGTRTTPASTITVGSKNFTEEFILGEIYAQALQAAGYEVKKDLNLGDRADRAQGAQGAATSTATRSTRAPP